MTPAEEYLFKAAQLNALAEDEANTELKLRFRNLASVCFRLADMLDRSARTEVKFLSIDPKSSWPID